MIERTPCYTGYGRVPIAYKSFRRDVLGLRTISYADLFRAPVRSKVRDQKIMRTEDVWSRKLSELTSCKPAVHQNPSEE